MNRASFSLLLGLSVFFFGAVGQSSALPTSVEGRALSSKGSQSLAKRFDVVQVAQTFVANSQGSGSGKERQSFESSFFEKEEEDKSCSFKTVTTDPDRILISYAGVLNHFEQMIQERLQAQTHSRLLIASDPISLLQRFQI